MSIVFSGQLSENSCCFLKKQERRQLSRLAIKFEIHAIIWIALTLLAYFVFRGGKNDFLPIFPLIIASAWQVCAIFAIGLLITRKNLSYPVEVAFSSGKINLTIKSFSPKNAQSQHEFDINNTTEVQDHGEFYYVISKEGKILCQKNLITEGTIEQFEEIFKDKIVCLHKKD